MQIKAFFEDLSGQAKQSNRARFSNVQISDHQNPI